MYNKEGRLLAFGSVSFQENNDLLTLETEATVWTEGAPLHAFTLCRPLFPLLPCVRVAVLLNSSYAKRGTAIKQRGRGQMRTRLAVGMSLSAVRANIRSAWSYNAKSGEECGGAGGKRAERGEVRLRCCDVAGFQTRVM